MKLPLSFEQLREKYPKPISALSRTPESKERIGNEYCVGGAFCLMLDAIDDNGEAFPTSGIIARILAEDYEVDDDRAFKLASRITYLNDKNDFEGAWKKIKEIYTLIGQA